MTHQKIVLDLLALLRDHLPRLRSLTPFLFHTRQLQPLSQYHLHSKFVHAPHDLIVNFLLVERQEPIPRMHERDLFGRDAISWTQVSKLGVVVQIGSVRGVLNTERSTTGDQN